MRIVPPSVWVLAAVLSVPATARASQQWPARIVDHEAAQQPDRVPPPGEVRSFLYSALVPGAGQWTLGLERWLPYLAVEAWSWSSYAGWRGEGKDLDRRYRDLAWSVARRISTRPRQETRFEYYEFMARFRASGAYDLEPMQPGLQPERDTTTYNGAIWALAQAIYLPAGEEAVALNAPAYEQALAFYQRRAIRPEFAWDWGEDVLGQQAYRELIKRSDESMRRATRALGLVLANHMVSAVDALIAARVRAAGVDPPFELDSGLDSAADGLRWRLEVRLAPFW